MSPLDHAYAEEHGLVESYLLDRLSDADRDAFEAHYFACEACLAQLEAASGFREGMRQVAAEDLARTAAARAHLGLLAGLALLSRGRRLALAGGLLLLLALPLGLLVANRGLERRLQEARNAAPAASAAAQRIASLEARLKTVQASDVGNRRRLEQELDKERQLRAAAATTAGPLVNLPIFALAAVRGGEEVGREPVNRLPLAPTAPAFILELALATVDYPAYRAALRDESGKELWQAGDLRPDSRDELVLLLPSRMLRPGVYQLTIEGLKGRAPGVVVAAYPFRVVPGR